MIKKWMFGDRKIWKWPSEYRRFWNFPFDIFKIQLKTFEKKTSHFHLYQVWQCGGSVELMPCSHVGHLFRISTYNFNGGDASVITARNNVRLIEVWMDEFKHLIYAANPSI